MLSSRVVCAPRRNRTRSNALLAGAGRLVEPDFVALRILERGDAAGRIVGDLLVGPLRLFANRLERSIDIVNLENDAAAASDRPAGEAIGNHAKPMAFTGIEFNELRVHLIRMRAIYPKTECVTIEHEQLLHVLGGICRKSDRSNCHAASFPQLSDL